jgi:hypothetical protein
MACYLCLSLLAGSPSSAQPSPVQSGGNTQAQAAVSCLKEIRGTSAQQDSVPGVDCTAVQTPWWRQPTWGSLIIGLLGVASAAAGTITVASKFGFQKSPGG